MPPCYRQRSAPEQISMSRHVVSYTSGSASEMSIRTRGHSKLHKGVSTRAVYQGTEQGTGQGQHQRMGTEQGTGQGQHQRMGTEQGTGQGQHQRTGTEQGTGQGQHQKMGTEQGTGQGEHGTARASCWARDKTKALSKQRSGTSLWPMQISETNTLPNAGLTQHLSLIHI